MHPPLGASAIEELIYRDGPNCHWCKKPVPADQRTRDHIVPRCVRGSNEMDNLVLACKVCNELRGSTNAPEWAAAIEQALADGYSFPAMVAKSRLKNAGRFGLPYAAEGITPEMAAANERIARFAAARAARAIAAGVRELAKPKVVSKPHVAGRRPSGPFPPYSYKLVCTACEVDWPCRWAPQPGGNQVPPAERRRARLTRAYGLDQPEVKPREGHYVVRSGMRRAQHGKMVFTSTCGGCLQPWPCDGTAAEGLF